MAAGTVISGGFPGRVAQEVQPNPKCSGCLHYDGQAGRTGACLIGERPWNCGDGSAQDVGYAPIARGAGSYLPDLGNHGAHAPEVDTQFVSEMYGSGSTRPVTFHQVSLGEEHVHLVKSMVERHAEIQKSQCRLCSMRGARGSAPPNVGYQLCTCAPLPAEVVAKALVDRMSNAQRLANPVDGVAEWVREVAKAGFRLPVPKKVRSFGAHIIDSMRRREDMTEGKPSKRSLSDQVKVDDSGGHLQPIEKGTFYHPNGAYDVTPAGFGKQHVHFRPHGGGETKHIGTFGSHREARLAARSHAQRVASGSGKMTPSTEAPTRPGMRIAHDDSSSEMEPSSGVPRPWVGVKSIISKAIDNSKHSHVVTGKLAPLGQGYSSRNAAHRAVDKLDNKYGAAAHSVSRNPNYRPSKLKFEPSSAYGSGAHIAEAGHGTYIRQPATNGGHNLTYAPHGQGEAGHMHGGWHGTIDAAHTAANEHHAKLTGG